MRRIGALLGALTLATTLAGCWEQAGYDAGRSYFNSGETALTSATIDDAVELWSEDIGDQPAVNLLSANGKVFAADLSSDVPTLVGLNAGTGAELWSWTPDSPGIGTASSNAVYRDGSLEIAATVGTFGGVTRISGDTGVVLSQGPREPGNYNLAVADGVLARGGGSPCCPPAPSAFISWVDWRCEVQAIGSLSGARGGDAYALIGTDLMWSFGTMARGYRNCDTATKAWGPPWETNLGGTPVAVAAVGTDRVVYLDDTSTMTLLDAATGASIWTAEVGLSDGRPAVAGGTIFLASADNRLVAYSAATGTETWSAPLGAQGLPPVIASDVVYTAVGFDVVAFDADGCGAPSCSPLATLDAGGTVAEAPIVDDGRLIVGTNDGQVVAFGLPA